MKRLPSLVVIVMLASACRFSNPSTPKHYWTALEAYDKMQPAMLAWQSDAVVISVSTGFDERQPAWCVQPDGKAPVWIYGVISPMALRGMSIVVRDDSVIVASEGEHTIGAPNLQKIFTLESVISATVDTDEAVRIALSNGTQSDIRPVEISTSQFNSRTGKHIPPAWILVYGHPYELLRQKWIFVDMVTHEVIWSDFSPMSPAPR